MDLNLLPSSIFLHIVIEMFIPITAILVCVCWQIAGASFGLHKVRLTVEYAVLLKLLTYLYDNSCIFLTTTISIHALN